MELSTIPIPYYIKSTNDFIVGTRQPTLHPYIFGRPIIKYNNIGSTNDTPNNLFIFDINKDNSKQ